MEPKIPDWITADFLKQSLQSDDRYRDIEVIDFKASLAAPAGNNYGSLVVRVAVNCKVRGEDHKQSVIAKGPVTEGGLGEFLSQIKNSESSFYNVFLPEANKLSDIRFAPDTFHSPILSVVVMEDLKEAGYLMADRVKRLDLEHCLLYTKAAAAFHAVSMALYKQDPDMINSVLGDNLYTDKSVAKNVIINMNNWALECMANNIPDKRISGIVKDSSKYMWRLIVDMHRPISNSFNSVCQLDPWTTNMMFKYDTHGNVCDIKLIDFQSVMYSSPIHDLVFFIWWSANDDVRKYHLHRLYSNYFTELNNNLRELGCQQICYDTFMDTVKMFHPFALVAAATSATILNSSPADFNEIMSKGMGGDASDRTNPLERYYTEDFCQIVLPQMVDHLAKEGVFDYMEDKIKTLSNTSS